MEQGEPREGGALLDKGTGALAGDNVNPEVGELDDKIIR